MEKSSTFSYLVQPWQWVHGRGLADPPGRSDRLLLPAVPFPWPFQQRQQQGHHFPTFLQPKTLIYAVAGLGSVNLATEAVPL